MPKQRQQATDLTFLKEYLRKFEATLSRDGSRPEVDFGAIWSRQGEGSIWLDAEEWDIYRQLLSKVIHRFSFESNLSEKAIDSALKDAIFSVVGLADSNDNDVEGRIGQAMEELRRTLIPPSMAYECWIQVDGLAPSGLPGSFGATRFVEIGEKDIDQLMSIVETKHKMQREEKIQWLQGSLGDRIRGRTVAIQTVNARDDSVALALAEDEVEVTLECLNFFAELIPYNRSRLRVPVGGRERGNTLRMAIAETGSFLHSPRASKPSTYSLRRLREDEGPIREVVQRVEALHSADTLTKVEELLLRAVRWCGRAAAAQSPEDKLLFATVALECLAIPDNSNELTYRLSHRAARLLGTELDHRMEIAKEVKRLYGMRSKVVHDGRFEVTEDDSGMAYAIAMRITLRLLTDPEIQEARSVQDLRDFFEKLALT